MNSSSDIYIGIDPTTGRKDFGYGVLDNHLNLIDLSDADMEEMVAYIDKYDSAYVAINAPRQVNTGVVKKKLAETTEKQGRSLRGADIRLAEYELRKLGISISGTPSQGKFCPAWMRAGFHLYQELSKIGYHPLGNGESSRVFIETHPHVCYSVLVEGTLFSKSTLEGRLQRQLILNNLNLRIVDGMDFFEEITRFKLLQGILPTDVLFSPDELDVLVATYTAWLSSNHPGEVIILGDKSEGQMVLPINELKVSY